MSKSRKILIAVDDSQHSQHAFDWYFSNVRNDEDTLLVVHAIEMPYLPTMPAHAVMVKDIFEEAEKDAKAVVEKFKSQLEDRNVTARVVSGHGKAGEYVCDVAKQEHVDYLILGTRGMGKVRRTILGSVSDHVLHHAHCPVLICRQ